MRSITHCPACQTQFFVTEEQLNKHHGKVRCGQCLHVFDAKAQIIDAESAPESNLAAVEEAVVSEPSANDEALNSAQTSVAEGVESSTAASADATNTAVTVDYSAPDTDTSSSDTGNSANEAFISDDQPYNYDDLADKSKFNANSNANKSRIWLWGLSALFLVLIAITQSVYFLRNEIAIFYPNAKPFLVQACKQFACRIDLPKKIEFIVIDDSDIQEDSNYAGLMHLTSTLINQAAFNQAYPNIELTLTDVDDKPILRRVFKPGEYLPDHTNIANGLGPGEELNIKLAMTAQGVTVAGYRVFVTY